MKIPSRRWSVVALALLVAAAGVAIPNRSLIRFHLRGNALIDRADRISRAAKAFHQSDALRALGKSSLNGFSLRLDDALDAGMFEGHAAPGTAEQVAAPPFGYEFDDPAFIGLLPASAEFRLEEGALVLSPGRDDFLHNPQAIHLDSSKLAEIEIRLRLREGRRFHFGWSHQSHPAFWARAGGPDDRPAIDFDRLHAWIDVDVVRDGRFHTYRLNAETTFKRTSTPDHIVRKLFLIPSDVEGDDVAIDYIRFVSKRARYSRSPYGKAQETRDGEMRELIYMNTPASLQYTIDLPDGAARFDFGISVLEPDEPVRFSAQVVTDEGEESLFAATIERNETWSDYRIDLSRWMGRRIGLRLVTASPGGNIAFWSNPVVYGAPEKRFNVILVVEDSLRADHLAHYGYHRPTSPARDAWAREGLVFRRAIAQATQTRPSVASLMTSLYPTATGVWRQTEALNASYLTLAEILRSQGFVTASFIQNFNAGPHAGLHQGFSYLVDAARLGYTPDGLFGERLFAWIDSHRDRNFFLYLHVWDPHFQYDPPASLRSWYEEAGAGTPVEPSSRYDPYWVENPTVEGRNALYDGEVLNNDLMFATLLERLDLAGLRDDTLIILTADHGEFLGERGEWGHHPPGYREIVQVPLMMVYPGVFPARQEIHAAVELIDLMPTILDLAGIERSPLLLQGDSLLALIDQGSGSGWNHRLSMSEEVVKKLKSNRKPWASLFHDDLHLINSDSFTDGPIILTNSWRPDHTDESAGVMFEPLWRRSFTRTIDRVQGLNMETWKALSLKSGLSEEDISVDPEEIRRLEALGYL